MNRQTYVYLAVMAILLLVAACGSEGGAPADDASTTSPATGAPSGSTPTPASRDSGPDTPTPEATSTPTAAFAGYTLDLSQGDFWEYRWSYGDTSCAQGSGCSTKEDEGVFQVTLGVQSEIDGVTMFEIGLSGDHSVSLSGENRDFAPRWRYMGSAADRIVVSNGSKLTTLFDGRTGKWAGSGFFTDRFNSDELVVAQSGSLSSSFDIAEWEGVEPGRWNFVGRAASQSQCETIVGVRVCPREEAFSSTENEYYRPGIGPVAYRFSHSFSFSGGNFFSSYSTNEWVALTASSMRGDAPAPTPTPIPPTPTPVPPPEPPDVGSLRPLFGPEDGGLRLDPRATQIPDFSTGLSLDKGVVSVTFDVPGVSDGRWSQGLTFRQSEEEVFHAVYIQGNGTWGHFVRTGSLSSERDLDGGFVGLGGSTNELTIVFDSTEGELFLNGQFLAELDLSTSGVLGAGDIRVMSGLLATDHMDGSLSEYSDFVIYPLP